MRKALLLSVVAVGLIVVSCQPWLVKETTSPKGGVFGWKGDKDLFMRNYCHGEYRETDSWDGTQAGGNYQFTVGHGAYKTQQNVQLQAGYYYIAFYCPDTMPEQKEQDVHINVTQSVVQTSSQNVCAPPCTCMCPQN